ncbi:type II toxin-antitoxin system HicB family antitoxin [Acaryochloris sp. CCMEE 5410]|uniref:type II toxin-antitoxin system HicB family antitoxin n=1 Tax=Acaryochloris sp. CCMEE 5410 TaxID=310037 RepID=UPI0002483EE5|nr:hypothetical protein [Acaryochloris sp. CCMEE 5410]KAI9130081.1 type II toxin-antitoxin system HicB family antitoxin [Acaryochloris sp. CCMEE 5410]
MLIRAVLEWDAEAESYSATCPELNFVSSYGESREAAMVSDRPASKGGATLTAIANLKNAIQLMLEPLPDHLLEMQSTADVVELAL